MPAPQRFNAATRLDCLGNTEEAFSQGAFQEFRQRLIRHDMDRVLLEKTIELARTTQAFD